MRLGGGGCIDEKCHFQLIDVTHAPRRITSLLQSIRKLALPVLTFWLIGLTPAPNRTKLISRMGWFTDTQTPRLANRFVDHKEFET